MEITLEHSLAPGAKAAPYDVRQIKIALNRLGFFTPAPKKGITDKPDAHFYDALYAFQRANGIPLDDIAGPGSMTERVLNRELKNSPADQSYRWHTVGDEKVRGAHASRNNKKFTWDQPPDGGHPGEDYNCRCWAELDTPVHHPWIEWVETREEDRKAREKISQDGFKGPEVGISDMINNAAPLDTINPTVSPLDFIGGGIASKTGRAVTAFGSRLITSKLRDTSWINQTSRSQIQHAFEHAKDFGIKGNWNNTNLAKFIKVIKEHIKSPDTLVIKGTYHKRPVTHYYNPKTKLNIIRDANGELESGWKLSPKQIFNIQKTGKLGGSK